MQINIFKLICQEFNLGNLVEFRIGQEGVSNNKYKIVTDKGIYFVKVFKNRNNREVSFICDIEQHMKLQGIPAVSMIGNIRGGMWMNLEGTIYTVYPFIESDRKHLYSLSEYEKIGELAAKIHLAGQKDVPGQFFNHFLPKITKEEGLKKLLEAKNKILSKVEQDEDDRKLLEYLEYRVKVAPTLKEGSTNVRDTIVHGDYHPGNLLFDPQTRDIVGVCDWERVEYGSRASDFIHSLIYTCFHRGYIYEKAIENARAMLKGYMKEFPISKPEIEDGIYAHLNLVILSTWIEDEHYINKRPNVVDIIPHELSVTRLCTDGTILKDLHFL